jgi:GT2 family glycosyltransferase
VPGVSAVIVTYKTPELTRRCIESLEAHASDRPFEVVVVDNGTGPNLGFARGANAGMRRAAHAYLLLANSDTYVTSDAVEQMARVLDTRPAVDVVGCRLTFPDGRVQRPAKRALSVTRSLVEDLWLYRLVPRRRWPHLLLGGYFDHASETECDWLAAAFVMLRREVFERTGGFDESFFMYGEDAEWFTRARRAGFRLLYSPVATVIHEGRGSEAPGDNDWLRRCHLGGLRAYERLHGRPRMHLYRAARWFGASVRAFVYRLAPSNDYVDAQAASHRELAAIYRSPWRTRPPDARSSVRC